MKTKILPPDTPDELWPVPYSERKVRNCLPIPRNVVKSMRKAGIVTLDDLDTYLMRGGEITDLSGVGEVRAEQIMSTLQSLRKTKKWTE